jgi:hypothetical protein
MEAAITLREPCRIHCRPLTSLKTKLTRARGRLLPTRPHAASLDNGWSFYRVRVPW